MCAKRWLWERARAARSKAPNRSSLWSFTVLHKHITQIYMADMQAKHRKLKLILMKKAITSYKCYFTFYLVTKEIFSRTLLFLCHFNSFTFLISHLLLLFFNYICVSVYTFYIHIYFIYIHIYILKIYHI